MGLRAGPLVSVNLRSQLPARTSEAEPSVPAAETDAVCSRPTVLASSVFFHSCFSLLFSLGSSCPLVIFMLVSGVAFPGAVLFFSHPSVVLKPLLSFQCHPCARPSAVPVWSLWILLVLGTSSAFVASGWERMEGPGRARGRVFWLELFGVRRSQRQAAESCEGAGWGGEGPAAPSESGGFWGPQSFSASSSLSQVLPAVPAGVGAVVHPPSLRRKSDVCGSSLSGGRGPSSPPVALTPALCPAGCFRSHRAGPLGPPGYAVVLLCRLPRGGFSALSPSQCDRPGARVPVPGSIVATTGDDASCLEA